MNSADISRTDSCFMWGLRMMQLAQQSSAEIIYVRVRNSLELLSSGLLYTKATVVISANNKQFEYIITGYVQCENCLYEPKIDITA